MVFLAAVAVAAAVGGLGPGVLATLFSIGIIDFFYLSPRYSFVVLATTDLLMLGVFTAIALLLSGVGEALRAAHQRALDERERALGVSVFLERQLRLSEELRGAKTILSTPIPRARRPAE
jgi:two-component system sensor histidine kinase KdpD